MTAATLTLAAALLLDGYLTRRNATRTADRAEKAAREAHEHAMIAGRMAGIAAFDRQGVTR